MVVKGPLVGWNIFSRVVNLNVIQLFGSRRGDEDDFLVNEET